MADSLDNWSTNASDAITISLVAPTATGQVAPVSKFQPKFTYSIFGDEERIFGYQGLKINLRYNASDMRPHLAIQSSKKFKAIGETEPDNVKELLEDYLPEVAFQKSSDFEAAIKSVPENWTPPGQKIASYSAKKKSGGTFEIWKSTLDDPAVKQLISRIQILVSFFIEGGTPLDVDQEDADRWTVYFLYCRKTDPSSNRETYQFAGYCTVYRFYICQLPSPPASPVENGSGQPAVKDDLDLGDGNFDLSQLPSRSRISQFLITPQYQNQGNGSRFYGEIYAQYLDHPQTVELTVEDPNEAFDDMRDVCDLAYLRTRPDFSKLRINDSLKLHKNGLVPNDIVDPIAYNAIRRAVKIAPRQFARVVEMHIMSQLADSVRPGIELEEEKVMPKSTKAERHRYALWKVLVKSRLYRQHKDILGQLDVAERIEKLDETLSSVEFEYVRLLALHEARTKQAELAADSKGKRKAVQIGETQLPASKKARVEDGDE